MCGSNKGDGPRSYRGYATAQHKFTVQYGAKMGSMTLLIWLAISHRQCVSLIIPPICISCKPTCFADVGWQPRLHGKGALTPSECILTQNEKNDYMYFITKASIIISYVYVDMKVAVDMR